MNRPGKDQREDNTALFAFAVPNFAIGAVVIPAAAFMPNIYAKHTQVTLVALGTVAILLNFFGAMTDQLVGYFSDRTHSRLGARKPWIMAGMLMSVVGIYFAYIPPDDATIVWFTLSSLLCSVGYTCMAIPYMSWGSELTRDHDRRSRVFMWMSVSAQAGGLLLFTAPLVLFALSVLPNTEFGREQIAYITYGLMIALPILVLYAVLRAPQGNQVETAAKLRISELIAATRNNLPFLRFIGIFFIAVIGHGAYISLLVIFCDSYLSIGDKLPYLFIMSAVISLVTVYPWMSIVKRIGKHRSWAWSWVASALILPCFALIDPGPGAFLFVAMLMAAQAAVESVSNFVSGAMVADCIDYDTLKTGCDNSGSYFGLFNVMIKASAAIGGGFAFIVLGMFDYSVTEPASNGPWQITGLLFTALFLPATIKGLCAAMLWDFPINEHRQGVIRRRIEQRAERQNRQHALETATTPHQTLAPQT